jgi:hypothetical protein
VSCLFCPVFLHWLKVLFLFLTAGNGSIPSKDKRFENEVIVYTSEAVEDPQGLVSLSRGALILFALLCGGDYDQGVIKCGSTTAFGLARCGFGDKLLEAVQTFKLESKAFDNFLVQWRIDLQHELESNSRGMLRSRQPQLAQHIPHTFPDRDILQLYIDPFTSWSAPKNIPDTSLWKIKEPSIVQLVDFCMNNFNWKDLQLLRKKFESILWDGIFLQMLYSV